MKRRRKHYLKYIAGIGAAAVVAAASIPATSADFSDIAGSPHRDAINKLVQMGVIKGYPDGTFQPNKPLTRSDVVKLFGKYLVSLGYTIPGDYKTNMRFADLSPNSDDELLKYAALVKDVGVFQGSNGKLMPSNIMLREQMALVLVRAFSKIHQFDYIAYVQNRSFESDISDLYNASYEAVQAIKVLDYFNVTNVAQFNPKSPTTRGQFASFLYNMINVKPPISSEVTVRSAVALSKNELFVTLSDNSTHTVALQKPLEENVPTNVTFSINGKTYSATVTFHANEFKVLEVENLNGAQFVVRFNKQIQLPSTEDGKYLEDLFILTGIDKKGTVKFKKGELSADKRSYTITIASTDNPLAQRYELKINGVRSVEGDYLYKSQTVYFYEDTVKPKILGTEILNENQVKVLFSEPVNGQFSSIQFKLANGNNVTGISGKFEENATEIVFDLSEAKSFGKSIELNTKINVTFGKVTDVAGNVSQPDPLTVTIVKGKKDGVKPTLSSIAQTGARQFKLTFSEDMSPIKLSDLYVVKNGKAVGIEKVEQDERDKRSFYVTVSDYLDGMMTISTAPNRTVMDLSGETATFSRTYTFYYNPTKAKVLHTEVVRDENKEYLYVTFDRNVVVKANSRVTVSGTFIAGGRSYPLASASAVVHEVPGYPNQVRILLSDLMGGLDPENAQFYVDLSFENLTNEYNLAVVNASNVNFERTKDYTFNNSELKVLSIKTSKTDSDVEKNDRVIIQFNYPVDEESAANTKNYKLAGYKILEAIVVPSNPTQVELVVSSYNTSNERNPVLEIKDLKAQGSILVMKDFSQKIAMTDSTRPSYRSFNITDTREITLTFSEPLGEIEDDYFIAESSLENVEVSVASRNHPTDDKKIILTFDTDSPRGQTITIKLKPNKTIKDIYGNEVKNFYSITTYVPTSFW